jgi:hypothetical protein
MRKNIRIKILVNWKSIGGYNFIVIVTIQRNNLTAGGMK